VNRQTGLHTSKSSSFALIGPVSRNPGSQYLHYYSVSTSPKPPCTVSGKHSITCCEMRD